ncbi:MAG: hypothetical protein KC609_01330 [Myxococcales bacterium]|nr:hypothetical protein [Myxococcales bacterium]
MSHDHKTVLATEFNLPKGVSEVAAKDPGTYLQFNTQMTTFYQQTYGELSRFFLALRDCRLIGSRCPECAQVMVPAATWHCPMCNFAEMEEVELPHRGVLAATAPITIFPSAAFIGEAPFARGYVDVARDAEVASFLPSRLTTTTGLPRPGIFVKGIELALVFRDERQGTIRDIFWVPLAEVPEALRRKRPLFESDLDFESPVAPAVEHDSAHEVALETALAAMSAMAGKIERSPRAKKDLANRRHTIAFRTGGGDFTMEIADGALRVSRGLPPTSDFVAVVSDPSVFSKWVTNGSLTDAAVEGSLWLPDRKAFGVLPILDRLPRSVRRDVGE